MCVLRFSAGSTDLTTWHCLIPGPKGTSWEGGLYPLTMVFPSDYPASPPTCAFPPGFIHPNVYPTGKVCLSLLSNDDDLGGQWAPSLTVTQVGEECGTGTVPCTCGASCHFSAIGQLLCTS